MKLSCIGKLATLVTIAWTYASWPGEAHASVMTIGCADVNRSCTLQELVAGGSITASDKIFGNWIANDASTIPLDLSRITVLALDDQPQNPGLQFNANGTLATLGLEQIDLDLGFTVATLDGSPRIKDNSLQLDQFAFGPGNAGGLVQIAEAVFAANQIDLLGDKRVLADNRPPSSPTSILFDSAAFAAQPAIFVQTNILVTGDGPADTVGLDVFTQRFSQIPEPPIIAVLGVGLVALGLARRRQRCNRGAC